MMHAAFDNSEGQSKAVGLSGGDKSSLTLYRRVLSEFDHGQGAVVHKWPKDDAFFLVDC